MSIVILYILAILTANWLSSQLPPVNIFGVLVSLGTFTVGFTFILRDFVQNKYGRKKTYLFIFLAMVLSAVMALILGDGLPVVIASAIAFLVSESTDTEIYTRLGLPLHSRVWWSGLVGGTLDSTVFIILGLSPIGMNFMPWNAVPYAIIAQASIKILLQGIGAIIIKIVTEKNKRIKTINKD